MDNPRQYRRWWLRQKDKYERRGAALFRKHLRQAALSIPFDRLTKFTYSADIQGAIPEVSIRNAYRDMYLTIGLAHGRRIGASINKTIREEKNFSFGAFEPVFVQLIQNWLLGNGGRRIVIVRQSVADYLIQYIANSLDEGKDIRTISRELEKLVRSRGFYRWQIERIVRTETTAAANWAATIASENTGIIMEKEWISSNDARTRRRPEDQFDHVDVDGQKVAKEARFNVQGDLLRFPGDPEGNPANTINCRCSVAIIPKRDAEGRLIFSDNAVSLR